MIGKGYYDTAQLRVVGQSKGGIKKFSSDNTLILTADYNPDEEESYDPAEDVELMSNSIGDQKDIYATDIGFENNRAYGTGASYFTFNGSSSLLGPPKSGGSHEGKSSFSLNLSQDFTASHWVRMANGISASSDAVILGVGSTSAYGLALIISNYKPEIWANGSFSLGQGNKSQSSFVIQPDEWCNISLVKSGSNILLYINGSFSKGSYEGIGSLVTATSEITLGRAQDGLGYSYTGTSTQLNRTLIYSEALTSSEMRRNYLSTRGLYL
jgi:hypothetical protein